MNEDKPKVPPAVDSRTIDHRSSPVPADCPVCHTRIILHCDQCKIKVTGCSCELADKVKEAQDEATEERLKKMGFWTPEDGDYG